MEPAVSSVRIIISWTKTENVAQLVTNVRLGMTKPENVPLVSQATELQSTESVHHHQSDLPQLLLPLITHQSKTHQSKTIVKSTDILTIQTNGLPQLTADVEKYVKSVIQVSI
jgi:hypothetical protein